VSRPPAILRLARVGSTMDALHELAESGTPAGTAVVADVQQAGRGSRGRTWISPAGGLWCSVLARPIDPSIELLSLRVGLAVAAALSGVGAGLGVRLKWPNDLMLGERKTGGVLCEARWQGGALAWVAIGVGLNVTNAPPPELAHLATHLASVFPSLTPAALVEPVVDAIRRIGSLAGPLHADELEALAGLDWLRGRVLEAPVAGTADGIAADGALRVRAPDGDVTHLRAGTIVLASSPAIADLRPCS
jgi:BirA family biotin operon repressor/biotin-[acetyl-CoA-carboxylase] ligase